MDPVTEQLLLQLGLQLVTQGAIYLQRMQEARAGGPPITAADVEQAHADYLAVKARLDAALAAGPKAQPPAGGAA